MKITFSNLGAIKKTTLDLRPLTVIIGPNNSNKTYIAYSIYGLWQLLFGLSMQMALNLKFKQPDENTLVININDFFKTLDDILGKKVLAFKDSLIGFFQDSSQKIFEKTGFDVEISKGDLTNKLKSHFKDYEVSIGGELKVSLDDDYIQFTFKEGKREKYLEDFLQTFELENLEMAVAYIISRLFSLPLLLPAERNAFIITYKMLANRRYKFLREAQRNIFSRRVSERQLDLYKEQGDIRYPQPIEDFLDFLTDVELETKFVIRKGDEFDQLADKIEFEIQRKNKTNFVPTKLGGNEIKINVKKGLDIDLYNASSSIKQLAPLLLYLRYRAQENDLLIIDEPEMNLHPESQAKLLEVLGMLVNAGVNVLLTTHSPYFMSHLNNLISGDMTDEKIREKQAKSLYLDDARAFLSKDDVSAYEMRLDKTGKHQELFDLKDDDYGIRWDTLSDVSDEIQHKFFEIYENGKKASKGKEE